MTEEEILADFPDLEPEDIRAVLAFAAARECSSSRNVLVGVDPEAGEVLTVPAQSTPRLKAAREAAGGAP